MTPRTAGEMTKRDCSERFPSICLHDLFEAQARRSPHAVAVVHRGRHVSYEALDDRANRLAGRLQDMGVRREVTVGVRLEPSIELVVALVAVLKAGGAYVPIAPATPRRRLEHVVAETGAHVLLAGCSDGRPGLGCPVLVVEASSPTGTGVSSPAVDGRVTPDNLAYILYTSGSTGTPKGVMVPHSGICNTLTWRQDTYPFTPDDRVLLTLSFAFDASIFELFQPLISGASVVIPDRELGGDPALVIEAIRRHRITVLGAVPSSLTQLVMDPELADCASLRLVFSGGEPLTSDLVAAIRAAVDVDVVNVYGPTEASMEATASTCTRGSPVTIGRPIRNMRAHVLDDHLEPVANGVAGHLYLAGVGLARGYWRDQAMTADRFVPNPCDGAIGARMYRTGDRCRRRADGTLEYVGRDDQQVKVGGQRLEFGEVEATLRRHPAVSDCAVLLDRGSGDDAILVAFTVVANGSTPTTPELRRHLAHWLPQYMVPSAFVFVDELPRTLTGKVDRNGLSLMRRRHDSHRTRRLPRTTLERLVAALWVDVLGESDICADDDFFDLGGTSIHAAMLARRLEEALREHVYSVAVYDAPTVAGLATHLRANYPHAVRSLGSEDQSVAPTQPGPAVSDIELAELQRAIRPLTARSPKPSGRRNPSAVFILSPPRCGSTLLRAMLGGHPSLFAPPELQLLNFDTLRDRRAAFASDRDAFWLQGAVRALMALCRCDAEVASRIMAGCEARDLSVKEFYLFMQDRLGDDVMLVDKTPTYSLRREILERAERDFVNPKYIHLVRHPAAAMASFHDVRLQVFFRPFLWFDYVPDDRNFAELVWTLSQQNIVEFLTHIPAHRQYLVRFEELVNSPQRILEGVAAFLGLPYDARMHDPYGQDQQTLMTDPVHPLARMLGDVKFSQHTTVRADVARRRAIDGQPEPTLGRATREVAARLGYLE
jgi:amino acid adenylation domain-containing protein